MSTKEKEFNADGLEFGESDEEPDDLLATLDEQQKTAVQLDEIKRATIEPGLMRLPVKQVTSAENSEQLVIEVHHPAEENPRFYLPKPRMWEPSKYRLPKLLDWYGYKSTNYHVLQTGKLYLRHGDTRGRCIEGEGKNDWVIVPPPEWSPPRLQRMKDYAKDKTRSLRRPSLLTASFFILQFIGLAAAGLFIGMGVVPALLVTLFTAWLYGVVEAVKEA